MTYKRIGLGLIAAAGAGIADMTLRPAA